MLVNLRIEAGSEPLEEETCILLFQAVRELLLNVVQHAHTDWATVWMIRTGSCVRVEVSDHGDGFDPSSLANRTASRSGLGLFSIRERLELIGGHLEIESAPGHGSRFVLVAPQQPMVRD
jgi:signal transduction histidine kinase